MGGCILMASIARLYMYIRMDIPEGLNGEQIAGSLYSLIRQKYACSIDTTTRIFIGNQEDEE